MVWLFGGCSFFAAALLFLVEPLVAKTMLPYFGGSPTVWNTCTFFFQTVLLLGYLVVHLSTRWLGRRQPWLHLTLMAATALALPLAVPAALGEGSAEAPFRSLIAALVAFVAVPFAVISMTGPVLQRWFAWTDHPRAADPYFLYSASNAGSFVGLLAYPFLVEPTTSLGGQRLVWSLAFAVLLGVLAICAAITLRSRRVPTTAPAQRAQGRPSRRRRLSWVALAFLPSSLMLGVTTYITSDVAAVPLLWVLPLTAYLATYVVAFARRSREAPRRLVLLAVAFAVPAWVTSQLVLGLPVLLSLAFHLAAFTVIALAAHVRLAADRPATEHLTEFYVLVSAGGALGGLVNGLLAPVALNRALEYSLALAAVPLLGLGVLRPPDGLLERVPRATARLGLALGAAVAASAGVVAVWAGFAWAGALLLAALAVVGAALAGRPAVTAGVLGTALAVGAASPTVQVLDRSRTFFGTYRVESAPDRHEFVHGTTVHGVQMLEPAQRAVATGYYAPAGPAGDVFRVAGDREGARVGLVGLGVGALATYARPDQSWRAYEIDPEVVRIARDRSLFSYVDDAAVDLAVRVGDGRLLVAAEPPGSLDVLVLDAFSSDAIPVHLLTVEAFRAYLGAVAPDGVVVVHLSNRYFDLAPVLRGAAAATGATLRLRAAEGSGPAPAGSRWAVLTRSPDWVAAVEAAGWTGSEGSRVTWTDAYSSVVGVLRR